MSIASAYSRRRRLAAHSVDVCPSAETAEVWRELLICLLRLHLVLPLHAASMRGV